MRNSPLQNSFAQHHSHHMWEKGFSIDSQPILQGMTKAPSQVCKKDSGIDLQLKHKETKTIVIGT